MKFTIREYVYVAVLLALLGSSYWFIFHKANQRREDLRTDIEAKKKALGELKRSTIGIDDLGRKIEDLHKAITFFESKLPQEREVDKILKEVWQMAEANSLQARTIRTLRSERGSHYSEQPIQMTLSGNFNGFYAFLLELEKLPRLTRITQLNLQKNNDRDGEMTAQLTLSIFFEPDTTHAAIDR